MKKRNIIKTILLTGLAGISMVGCDVVAIQPSSASSNNNSSSSSGSINLDPPGEVLQEVYSNPVNVTYKGGSGTYSSEIADPTVVRGDDGYFYIFSTQRKVLRSEDACNWEIFSESIISRPTWGDEMYEGNTPEVWAPDVVKVGDQWIYYYSLSGWSAPCGIGYAVSDSVDGPYTDMGKMFTGDEMGIKNCIDPQVFVDDDGSVFMTVGSFQGLYVVELTEDGTELLYGIDPSNKTLIAGYNGGWDGATYEGGYIMKRNDYYYYFGSAGTCCAGKDSTYSVYVGKSEDVFGPYVDSTGMPMTSSRGTSTYGELVVRKPMSMDGIVAGVGHNSILLDDYGDYWIYYHGYSEKDNFKTRHLFMDKLLWDENGFPYVEGKRPSFDEELDGPVFII